MAIFYTPPGYSGQSELTASTGLTVVEQGTWRFSQSGYNDSATFGASLTGPSRGDPGAPTVDPGAGTLHLSAQDWTIAEIGNQLTSYTDGEVTYPASKCRIQVTGQWKIVRQPNSNSFNSQGVIYSGRTETDEGNRDMGEFLLNFTTTPPVTYVIQGADVTGGALNTFSSHVFYCRITEAATTDNSNREFQSNSIARPVWAYTYTKSWQTD